MNTINKPVAWIAPGDLKTFQECKPHEALRVDLMQQCGQAHTIPIYFGEPSATEDASEPTREHAFILAEAACQTEAGEFSGSARVATFDKVRWAIDEAARLAQNATIERCAQLVDRIAKEKHERGSDAALVRTIAGRLRALKTEPTKGRS
ncbi:MAG: hypothetical protein VB131_06845 [Burkholderia gladioli]